MDYIFSCAQKLTNSQLNLLYGTKQKRVNKKSTRLLRYTFNFVLLKNGMHVFTQFTSPLVGVRSIAISVSVSLSVWTSVLCVCSLSYLKNDMPKFHEVFCTCYPWLWLLARSSFNDSVIHYVLLVLCMT